MSKDNRYERKVRCKGLSFFSLSSSCTLSCSLRLNFAKSLLILCLVRSVSTCEARSSASTSSSSFILTEGDFLNNQFLLRHITGWSIEQFAALSTSQSGLCRLLNSIFGSHIRGGCLTTRLGDNSLLSEKRRLLFVFLKETIQSPPGCLGIVRQNFFTWGPTLNVATPKSSRCLYGQYAFYGLMSHVLVKQLLSVRVKICEVWCYQNMFELSFLSF